MADPNPYLPVLLLCPFLAAVLILAVDVLGPSSTMPTYAVWSGRKGQIHYLLTLLAAGSALLVTLSAFQELPARFHVNLVWGISLDLYLDALSYFFVLLVNLVALFAAFYTRPYLLAQTERLTRSNPVLFYIGFNVFYFTMLVVPLVDNLVILWIALASTTAVSAYLVGYRHDLFALEATWKYTLISSTGIIFALLGTLFLANAVPREVFVTGTTLAGEWSALNWSYLIELAPRFNPNFAKMSFLFILVGYGTKAGFAPMHTWLPDAHSEAPYPVSALLSGVLLKSALYAILRFYTLTNQALADGEAFTSTILTIWGLFSLGLAVPFILKDNPFKRVLAYHSLEHMGIIIFGLGIGTPAALFGALLHTLNHALTKALMFLAFGLVRANYPAGLDPQNRDYPGIFRAMPWTGALLSLGGLALVGSPPFNLFVSEFMILWAAIEQGLPHSNFLFIAAIGLFLAAIILIFAGLMRHLGPMLLGEPPAAAAAERFGQVGPLLVLFGLILILGFTLPTIGTLNLYQLLNHSTAILTCGSLKCLP